MPWTPFQEFFAEDKTIHPDEPTGINEPPHFWSYSTFGISLPTLTVILEEFSRGSAIVLVRLGSPAVSSAEGGRNPDPGSREGEMGLPFFFGEVGLLKGSLAVFLLRVVRWLVWFGLVWFGLVWFNLVWFRLVWLVGWCLRQIKLGHTARTEAFGLDGCDAFLALPGWPPKKEPRSVWLLKAYPV